MLSGMLCGFVLELRHAGKLSELGVAVENPGQLRVGGHVALNKKDRLFPRPFRRRAAARKRSKRVAAQGGRILAAR